MLERGLIEHLGQNWLDGEEQRPAWLNSALLGGGMVLFFTLRRIGGFLGLAVLTVLAIAMVGPAKALWIPGLVVLATLCGMLGGVAFSMFRPRRGSATFLTDWVSWTVGMIIYAAGFFAVTNAMGIIKMPLSSPISWIAIAGLSTVYSGVIAWMARPAEYVRGGDPPLTPSQRQVARRAASKRLWDEVESRLQERERVYERLLSSGLPEEKERVAHLLQEQLADLDRTERALHVSIRTQGFGRKELAESIRWRERIAESLRHSGAA